MLDIQVSLKFGKVDVINENQVCVDVRAFNFTCLFCSTTGALEAAYKQAFGKHISLSEQQLVDCAGAFNNFGCNGGLPSQAFEYIKYNGGLETEEAYPYTGKNGLCKFSAENVALQVVNSVNITLVRDFQQFIHFFL